jgi:hypothetical protein
VDKIKKAGLFLADNDSTLGIILNLVNYLFNKYLITVED